MVVWAYRVVCVRFIIDLYFGLSTEEDAAPRQLTVLNVDFITL
jgi:hypothetical protein